MTQKISLLHRLFVRVFYAFPAAWTVRLGYLWRFGRLPDLKDPKTFNEKVNWRKLYQRDPLFTIFADKIEVKDRLRKLIDSSYLIPTLWQGEHPENIPFDELESPYVIKVNHGYGGHIFIRRRSEIVERDICKEINRQLKHDYSVHKGQWCYRDIERRVLVEPLLVDEDGSLPDDIKFFVFEGKVHLIQMDHDLFGKHTRSHYDRDWHKLPMTISRPDLERELPKPGGLSGMIEAAEKIGSLFDFVSVDMYLFKGRGYFAEVTFYPDDGLERFHPEELDLYYGNLWKKTSVKPDDFES